MNMPDIEALQEIMSEMGGMDYEELKKRKRGAMPGMTKIEIESNQPINPQKLSEAVGGMGQGRQEMEIEMEDDDEEKKRRMLEGIRSKGGGMGMMGQ